MGKRNKQVVAVATTDAPEGEITSETQTPEAPKAPKLTPAERKAARLVAEAETRARGEVVRNAAGRPTARNLPCLCGCGNPTHRDEAMFLSGHDATLRKAVIEGKLDLNGLPAITIPFFKLGSPIAGLLLDDVDGVTLLDVKAK